MPLQVRIVVLSLGMLATLLCAAAAPKWTTQTPYGKRNAYAVGVGQSAKSLYEARQQSISDAMRVFSEQRGVTIESRFRSLTTEERQRIEDEVAIKGASTTLKGLRIVETYTPGHDPPYQVWTLMAMPTTDPTSRWSAMWRSTLLPGWGQFYQGKRIRGVGFLLAESAAIATALYTRTRQDDFERKAYSSGVSSMRRYYYDKADQYHQGNIIAVSAAVAFYALNLADALFISANRADLYYAETLFEGPSVGLVLRR